MIRGYRRHVPSHEKQNSDDALASVVLSAAFGAVTGAQSSVVPATRWYRGNTHTHTLASDGNAPALDVARWYKTHGYDFVVITDHELVTDVGPLNAQLAEPEKFLVLRGEEITQKVVDSLAQDGRRQAHVVAIGIANPILPLGEKGNATGTTMAAVYAGTSEQCARHAGSRRSIIRTFAGRFVRPTSRMFRTPACTRSGTVIRG